MLTNRYYQRVYTDAQKGEFSAIEITKDNILYFVEQELNEKYKDVPLTQINAVLKLVEEFR